MLAVVLWHLVVLVPESFSSWSLFVPLSFSLSLCVSVQKDLPLPRKSSRWVRCFHWGWMEKFCKQQFWQIPVVPPSRCFSAAPPGGSVSLLAGRHPDLPSRLDAVHGAETESCCSLAAAALLSRYLSPLPSVSQHHRPLINHLHTSLFYCICLFKIIIEVWHLFLLATVTIQRDTKGCMY